MPTYEFTATIDGSPYATFKREPDGRWVDDDGDHLPALLERVLDDLELALESAQS